jgi:hypothetical protein
MQWASIAGRRRDWPEALRRWEAIGEKFWNNEIDLSIARALECGNDPAGGNRTVSGSGMAESRICRARNRIGRQRRRIGQQSAQRPDRRDGYLRGAEALALLGRQDEAAQLRAEHRHHFAR